MSTAVDERTYQDLQHDEGGGEGEDHLGDQAQDEDRDLPQDEELAQGFEGVPVLEHCYISMGRGNT